MMLFGYGRENRLSYLPRKRFTVLNLTHERRIVQFSCVHRTIFSKNFSFNYINNNYLSALTPLRPLAIISVSSAGGSSPRVICLSRSRIN